LDFLNLSAGMLLGSSRVPQCWWEWKGCCESCHRIILDGGGIFCANFSKKQGDWIACQKVWCGHCYVPLDDNGFPIAKPVDEDGVVVSTLEDVRRYVVGQGGDHLVTPYQCDLCPFRNLMRGDPIHNLPQDARFLKLIR